ncbi:hypothetical protein [Methylotenera sp.]|uniref:hypothetical protein n=1 Tax=Methylotenera sp. TaxID=2051956 RepID=UPI00248A48D7|nr:hypothetical protein [Methylotenera sp.]MDI1363180.1 hypothetical protein [Methylotenera sp.]
MYPNDDVEGQIVINGQLVEKFTAPKFRPEFAMGLEVPFMKNNGGRFSCSFLSSMIVTGQSVENMRSGVSYEFHGPRIATFALNGGYEAASDGYRSREVQQLKFGISYQRDSFTCQLQGSALNTHFDEAKSPLENASLWEFRIEFYVPLEKAREVLSIGESPMKYFDERLSKL